MYIKNTLLETLLNRDKIQSKAEIIEIMKEYEEKFGIGNKQAMLKYLSRHKYIKRIFAELYYINSFDERIRGFCKFEDKEVLFMALNKMKVKWYVGLISALYRSGKIWQTPNQLSIINTKFSGNKKVDGLKTKFYKTKDDLIFGLKKSKTSNGVEYFYSDPAKTHIDRVYFREANSLIRVKNTKNYLKRYPKWVGKR